MIDLEGFDFIDSFSVLPPNVTRHFYATPLFLKFWKGYVKKRFVFEVGAGCCDFAKEMHKKRIKCLAIEPRANDEVLLECSSFLLPKTIYDASMLKTTAGVVVAARPDHSGWIHDVPDFIHPDSEFVYIGLEKNFEIDLLDEWKTEVLYENAGQDGEICLTIKY